MGLASTGCLWVWGELRPLTAPQLQHPHVLGTPAAPCQAPAAPRLAALTLDLPQGRIPHLAALTLDLPQGPSPAP